jgi:O-antigen ligase
MSGHARRSRNSSAAPRLRIPDNLTIFLLAAFIFLAVLFGGASRADALSQVVVRTFAILFGLAALLLVRRADFRELRSVLAFLVAFAALIAIQLVPLPPSVWQSLPGHEIIAQGATLAGIEQPWRPISLTPDATWNALLALLPGLAAALLFASVRDRDRSILPMVLLLLVLLSGIVGLVQVTLQAQWLYPYRFTNTGTAVGLLANRNHQALLLTMAYPLLATISVLRAREGQATPIHFLLFVIGLFLIPLILATGSRAGLALMILGMIASLLIILKSSGGDLTGSAKGALRQIPARLWIVSVAGIAAGLLVVATIYFSRAEALQRLFERDLAEDKRFLALWPTFDLAKTFLPFGSGFGSFPEAFKIYEPFELLDPTYMNHAHSDPIEIFVEGGIGAALLLLGFLFWVSRRTFLVWTAHSSDPRMTLARLGSCLVALALIASLVDYPLRTPTHSVIFVIACCWMALNPRVRRPSLDAE